MLVSPTFNSIAARLLYHTIKLSGNTASLFEAPRMSEEVKASRQTRDKVYNVTNYVHILDCSDHAQTGCLPQESLSDPLIVYPRVLRVVTEILDHRQLRHAGCCSCMNRISPRKLVCFEKGTSIATTTFLPKCADLKTTAIVRDDRLIKFSALFPTITFGQNMGRIVCINCLYSSPWIAYAPPFGLTEVSTWFGRFVERMSEAAQRVVCPSDIVFVNLDLIVARMAREKRDDVLYATRTMQKAYPDSIASFAGKAGRKTAEQAQQVKFKFISMKTYLADYDWEEDLTEEQVGPWLDTEREVVAGEAESEDEV